VTVEAYGPGADRFGELWRPAGDPVELPGVDHMAVIDPASPAWAEITRRLGRFT
jgi:hypothetical protein